MEILNPTVSDPAPRDRLSPRLPTLDGKVVGYIYSYGGERIPKRIDEILSERFNLAGRLWYNKPYLGEPAKREVLDEFLAQCDTVVLSLGG
jgi:hypothetical protein